MLENKKFVEIAARYMNENKTDTFDTHTNGIKMYVDGSINNIELQDGDLYFISIGEWETPDNKDGGKVEDVKKWEVFTLHYNKKTKACFEDWDNIPIDEDCLCQHKVFKSLKTAFNYAWRAAMKRQTPKDVNRIW